MTLPTAHGFETGLCSFGSETSCLAWNSSATVGCQSLFFLSSKQFIIAFIHHEKLSQGTTAGRKKQKQKQNPTNKKEETRESLACRESEDVGEETTFKTGPKKPPGLGKDGNSETRPKGKTRLAGARMRNRTFDCLG